MCLILIKLKEIIYCIYKFCGEDRMEFKVEICNRIVVREIWYIVICLNL